MGDSGDADSSDTDSADVGSSDTDSADVESSDTDSADAASSDTDSTDADTESTGGADADRGPLLTRRRLLLGGAGLVGVGGSGAFYVSRELDGDFGGYTAPDGFPTITTRGTFDDDGDRIDDRDTEPPDRDGEWSTPDDSDSLFVFVHGFDTGNDGARDQAYTSQLGLEEAAESSPVVGFSWDADRSWGTAKSIADENGRLLADWLVDRAATVDQSIHLLGYSLGARVSCEAVRTLVDDGHTDVIESVSLLGGAIPRDSVELAGRYGEALETVSVVGNFYSRNDRVLSWVYRVADRTRAVGHDGIREPANAPESYHDVDVTALVDDHYSYFQPEEGCLPRVVETIGI